MPAELLVLDDSMYSTTAEKARAALIGLDRGILMLCTSKDPEEVDYPYDFTGTVAVSDAKMICAEVLGLDPPPFGTAALGLYAAATNTVRFESIIAAILEHFPGKRGELNARAAEKVFESAKIKTDVTIKGRGPRPAHAYDEIPLSEVPVFRTFERTPLPGVSGGSPYLWREKLPVWIEKECTCGAECVLEDYCPERVIRFVNHELYREYIVDYEYCKGCGICAKECLHKAIVMKDAKEVYGK
jgi:pyruvate ferredoxin oxidoreductase delta subunit